MFDEEGREDRSSFRTGIPRRHTCDVSIPTRARRPTPGPTTVADTFSRQYGLITPAQLRIAGVDAHLQRRPRPAWGVAHVRLGRDRVVRHATGLAAATDGRDARVRTGSGHGGHRFAPPPHRRVRGVRGRVRDGPDRCQTAAARPGAPVAQSAIQRGRHDDARRHPHHDAARRARPRSGDRRRGTDRPSRGRCVAAASLTLLAAEVCRPLDGQRRSRLGRGLGGTGPNATRARSRGAGSSGWRVRRCAITESNSGTRCRYTTGDAASPCSTSPTPSSRSVSSVRAGPGTRHRPPVAPMPAAPGDSPGSGGTSSSCGGATSTTWPRSSTTSERRSSTDVAFAKHVRF